LAISLDYEAIAAVKHQTESLCPYALSKSKHAINFIKQKYKSEIVKNKYLELYGG